MSCQRLEVLPQTLRRLVRAANSFSCLPVRVLKGMAIKSRIGFALLLLAASSLATAQAPNLSWTATIDSGSAVNDSTRVIRRMNNGDLIAAAEVWRRAIEKFPDHALADEIRARMLLLR